jgi:polyhydroxyalkanoate synthesis regulator phasin
MAKSSIKKFIEAGVQFSEMSRDKAEEIVRKMVKSGDLRAKDAEQTIQTLVDRGRETTERIAAGVQAEVAKQLAVLQTQFELLESKLESLTGRGSGPAPEPAPPEPAPVATVSKARAKKSAAKKKSVTKKTAAKKSAAKKTAAKKTAAKKSSGAVGSSGVRPIRTTRSS